MLHLSVIVVGTSPSRTSRRNTSRIAPLRRAMRFDIPRLEILCMAALIAPRNCPAWSALRCSVENGTMESMDVRADWFLITLNGYQQPLGGLTGWLVDFWMRDNQLIFDQLLVEVFDICYGWIAVDWFTGWWSWSPTEFSPTHWFVQQPNGWWPGLILLLSWIIQLFLEASPTSVQNPLKTACV